MIRISPAQMEAARWTKSSYSSGGGNECVEAAQFSGVGLVGVRDSKDVGRGAFAASAASWTALLNVVRASA